MGRRSDHSREELKSLVITVAKEIIFHEGLSALSARKIALKIGYTVGTLYNVFSNIDDIILHVNGQTLDLLHSALAEQLDNTSTDHIEGLAMAYFRFSNTYYYLWNILFESRKRQGDSFPVWYQNKIDELFELIETTLSQHYPVPADKLKPMATLLWSGVHGICILYHAGKLDTAQIDSVQELIHTYIDIYLLGLAHVS